MPASDYSLDLAVLAARAAVEVKAENVLAIDVTDRLFLIEVFVIASASNERQVSAIAEAIEDDLRIKADVKPRAREGSQTSRWILLDFGDLVVHVMHTEDRAFYALERLWKDCPEVPMPADVLEANAIVEADRSPAVAD